MFEDVKNLPEKFGEVFAQQQIKVLAHSLNFHIGTDPQGRVCIDVNGANPELVAKGFLTFREALKKVKVIE